MTIIFIMSHREGPAVCLRQLKMGAHFIDKRAAGCALAGQMARMLVRKAHRAIGEAGRIRGCPGFLNGGTA